MEKSLVDAIALRSVPGLGDRNYKTLIDRHGCASRAIKALGRGGAGGLGPVTGSLREKAAETLRRISARGFWTISYGEPLYPFGLGAIHDPPAIIHGMGDKTCLDGFSIALVGSRKATTHGLAASRKLATELAAENVVVVSGLALGIDTEAHLGALDAGGRTVAVLGSGLDNIYPASNRGLAFRIAEKGAVITEHPPEARPDAGHFPRRNRIISGLARGVVVVEAAKKSGSLITASLALEQGREVFAMPGMARAASAQGANNLLRQGAVLAETADDVLAVFGIFAGTGWKKEPEGPEGPELPGEAAGLYAVVEDCPQDIDTLAAKAGLTPSSASAMLMELVLMGRVVQWPGQRYSLRIE